jgi:hypothetical protein
MYHPTEGPRRVTEAEYSALDGEWTDTPAEALEPPATDPLMDLTMRVERLEAAMTQLCKRKK